MNNEETQKDEALKADESDIEVESPVTEEEQVQEPTDVEQEESEGSPPEDEGEETESESTEEEEVEAAPADKGRKTAQSRIQELNAKKKAAEEKAESLEEQVKKLTDYKPEPISQPQSSEEPTEMTYEELMRRQAALVDLKLRQQENTNRVRQEASEAIRSYPELDPDSENFDQELSESVSQATLAKIQADPTASVSEFVDRLMKPYRRSVEKQASAQKEAITKQVSKQAVRPTQVQKQEKPFSELSIEEMEEKLGVLHR